MTTRTGMRNDYNIQKRREQESTLKNMYNYIKTDSNNLHKAKWETQSSKMMETKSLQKKKSDFQDQRRRFLDIRRKKISELLAAEEEGYRLEIISMQETPDQVRYKMESKLIKLKGEREKERLELVKHLNERKFYESADELRKNDSEAFAFACYLEQENQMLDKLKKREQEKVEEEVYVKLYNYDNLKKHEKEKIALQEKQKKQDETYKFLDWQKQAQDNAVRKHLEVKNYEAGKLKEQWERDLIREMEEKEKTRDVNKMVYRDIEEFNRAEELERQKRIDFEKMQDKELVHNILTKEKALDDLDKREKEKKIKDSVQNKKYLEYVMNQKKEAEAWMDKLAQIEADKQWQRTQEVWMKEEAARIELLKQVYKEREHAVHYKKNVSEQERVQISKERVELDQEIKNYTEAVERIKIEEAKRRKGHQDDLKYQMEEKEKMKLKNIQDKIYEERAAKLWEIEYQKKINDQREIHMKKLEEIKRREII